LVAICLRRAAAAVRTATGSQQQAANSQQRATSSEQGAALLTARCQLYAIDGKQLVASDGAIVAASWPMPAGR